MPYCRFKHGKMLQTKGKLSKRDGGLRQYYHCRCDSCSYTTLELIIKHKHVNEPSRCGIIYRRDNVCR